MPNSIVEPVLVEKLEKGINRESLTTTNSTVVQFDTLYNFFIIFLRVILV